MKHPLHHAYGQLHMYGFAIIVGLAKLEYNLPLLRLGWWKLVSLLLLALAEPDAYVYEIQLMNDYFAGVSGTLFVCHNQLLTG